MAIVLTDDKHYNDIASAIRDKKGISDKFLPSEMAGEILSISTGIDTSDATALASDISSGKTAYVDGSKIIGTHVEPVFVTQTKTVSPTESEQTITPDVNYDGLSQVKINAVSTTYVGSGITRQPAKTIIPTKESQTAVNSGTYTTGKITVGAIPSDYIITSDATATESDIKLNKTAYVNGILITGTHEERSIPEFSKQNKTVDPTEMTQTINADDGYDGLGTVTINAIPNDYVGSSIVKRTNSSVTVNGASVTTPAGYYSSEVVKNVNTVSQAEPTITVSESGLITAKTVQSTGYVSGTTKTKTQQLSTKGATTIIPTKSSQVAISKGVYTTGEISVNPIPDDYIITSDATATETDIISGKTAYVNGNLITGTYVVQTYSSQAKTVSPTESEQTVLPDSGYNGLSQVKVSAISSNYVGSAIPRPFGGDMLSGEFNESDTTYDVTISNGYYESDKTVPILLANAPELNAPTVSSGGLVTATMTVPDGEYYSRPEFVSNTSRTLQLTTQAAKTVTPTKSEQTAVASGRYTTGAVKVGAIPNEYIIPSGSDTKTENGTYDVTNLASFTVNIPFNTIRTGSTTPSSSLGVNGDIYIQI